MFRQILITDQKTAQKYHTDDVSALKAFVEGKTTFEISRLALMYRDKGVSDLVYLKKAQLLQNTCTKLGLTFILHQRFWLSQQLGVKVLHLTSRQDAVLVRDLLGARIIIGKSAHAEDLPDRFDAKILDYLTLSPVFAASSKVEDLRKTLGYEGFVNWSSNCPVCCFALGGMTPERSEIFGSSKSLSFAGISYWYCPNK